MSDLAKVNVLLSTYNGQEFLAEQLDSILAQKGVDIVLHIRDDGSTDQTKDILESYRGKFSKVKIVYGNNLGAKWSFMELLRNADSNCKYFSFCDQDDVWLPEKTISGIIKLDNLENKSPQLPLLYFSRIQLADKHLVPTKKTAHQTNIGFCNSLIQSSATGCCIIINSKARELISEKFPSFIMMHDWWCYLVCSSLGLVVYDRNCYIYQRKHLNNVTAHTTSRHMLIIKRLKMLYHNKKNKKSFIHQIKSFYHLYSDLLPSRNKKKIEQLLNSRNSLKNRLSITFDPEFRRNDMFEGEKFKTENIAFHFLFLINFFE